LAVPYSGAPNNDVYNIVMAGRKLPQPFTCSDKVYQVMMLCWQTDPNKRPSFSEVFHAGQTVHFPI
jgi:hypothetical protein